MSTQKATRTAATSRPRPRRPSIGADLIGSGQEGSIGDQVRAYFQRVRGGEMGALPAIGGFVVLTHPVHASSARSSSPSATSRTC